MASVRRHARSLVLDGESIDYTVVRMPRRRRLHVVVNDDASVEVRTPYRYPLSEADHVLRQHRQWLERTLGSARRRQRARPVFADGMPLSCLDERLILRLRSAGAPHVVRRGHELHVVAAGVRDETVPRERLERWYRGEARLLLGARLTTLAGEMGVQPGRMILRGQKTRWGSCSSTGTISLNWRLLLLPGELVDYVLIHELCHLRHLDHSPAFWSRVAEYCPDWRVLRRRLSAQRIAALPL